MSAVIHISSKKENGLEERNDFWYILQKKEKAREREGGGGRHIHCKNPYGINNLTTAVT